MITQTTKEFIVVKVLFTKYDKLIIIHYILVKYLRFAHLILMYAYLKPFFHCCKYTTGQIAILKDEIETDFGNKDSLKWCQDCSVVRFMHMDPMFTGSNQPLAKLEL